MVEAEPRRMELQSVSIQVSSRDQLGLKPWGQALRSAGEQASQGIRMRACMRTTSVFTFQEDPNVALYATWYSGCRLGSRDDHTQIAAPSCLPT